MEKFCPSSLLIWSKTLGANFSSEKCANFIKKKEKKTLIELTVKRVTA